jgi:hypothetical protein
VRIRTDRAHRAGAVVLAAAAAVASLIALAPSAPADGSESLVVDRTPIGAAETPNGIDPYYGRPEVLIPVNRKGVVMASRPTPDLRAGEILDVSSETEITNNISLGKRPDGYDIWATASAGIELMLTRSPTDTSGIVVHPLDEISFSAAVEHHHTFTERARYIVPSDLGNRYLNVVAVGYMSHGHSRHCVVRNGSSPAPPGDRGKRAPCVLTGEVGYGQLSVLRHVAVLPAGLPATATVLDSYSARVFRHLPGNPGEIPLGSQLTDLRDSDTPVMSAYVGALRAGDVLDLNAGAAGSLDYAIGQPPAPSNNFHPELCASMMANQVWLSPVPTGGPEDQPFSSGTAFNLSSQAPDESMAKAGALTVRRALPEGAWVVVKSRSALNLYCSPRTPLEFDPSKSWLTVVRYRAGD